MVLIGLFRIGYKIASDLNKARDHSLSLLCSAVYNLSILFLIMIPASVVNEKARETIRFLRYRIPKTEKDLKFEIEKDLVLERKLTLWNIFVFERSLIIGCLGSLLTYGILLATLGKDH
ncbi:hypothetical protein AVEN_6280-1 [Araneus ventricosus]|uniref:Gustatory receptor n=1 Tax=Araneus ventricosus TaxID=182803 RepID=A0A4Y2N3V5_ARAVE|nr:hypothetical protein AVEN_6280-1 [Araneus ventricosus]